MAAKQWNTSPAMAINTTSTYVVTMQTSRGEIKIEL